MSSFGAWLARERELRALTREDVARTTRLPPPSVAALEEDRFDALPGEAFTVGYIRSYAACIGLSADEAVLRYREARQAGEPAQEPARASRPLLPRALLAAAGLLLAAGAVGLAWLRLWRH
ncbi:MAG TPA: helix-turn-helix transcriptional regulator [Myxococcales bacterium]|nr:helix-turn-helix transcriptional regulator [Myxococcales bacterium]